MNDLEYRKLKEKGGVAFRNIDHEAYWNKNLDSRLNGIVDFLKKDQNDLKNYQLEKLSEIVDYAYQNIPLYKKKYDAVGYKVGSIKTFEDFEKLPLLYKDELIEGFPNEIVKDINDFKFSTRSSGSSGKFVTLSVDIDAIYTDTLQGIRQFIWQSNNDYSPNDTVLFIYTCPWWIQQIQGKYKLDYLPTTTKIEDAIQHIKQTRPFMISTYPTYLQKFCDHNIKLSDFGVKYVIVHSEQSSSELRKEMAKQLDVTVYDEYSSEELTRIALECPNYKYHLEEDACYIEVMDIETNMKIENGTGVVVGTNLLNKATPIIRYYLGDIVTIDSNEKCTCGNHGRILTKIQGRQMDCILSDGKSIPASSFMDLAYNWYLTFKIPLQGIRYQIVQVATDEVHVCLMKGLYELSENDLETIKQSMYSLVSTNMKVVVKYTDNFIYKSNKFKPVISLL